MNTQNTRFLNQCLPQYVENELDKIPEQIKQSDRKCEALLDGINNWKQFCHNQFKTQKCQNELFFLFCSIIQKYIIPLNQIKKNETISENYLFSWIITNLNQMDQFLVQLFLRLICLEAHFESKKHFEKSNINYQQLYQDDLTKIYLIIQTFNRMDKTLDVENEFYQICLKLNLKSTKFIRFLITWLKESQLTKCLEYLQSRKSSLKKKIQLQVMDKRTGFQNFKQEQSQNQECSNSQYLDQHSQQQNAENFKQVHTLQNIIKDKRLSQMIVQKRSDIQNITNFQEALQQQKLKDNHKIINNCEINRPLQVRQRTINGGINGKYKIENESKKVIMRSAGRKKGTTNNLSSHSTQESIHLIKQEQFCMVVSKKLEELQHRKKALSWNSEYLAPETPSNENSCFNN